MTFTSPSAATMMFCGLMSRWMMPCSWATSRAGVGCFRPRRCRAHPAVAGLNQLVERCASDELHGDVVQSVGFAEVMRTGDVWMGDPAGQPDFVLEALDRHWIDRQKVGAYQFDGHHVVQLTIAGLVHHTHSTLAQTREDLVAARKQLPRRQPSGRAGRTRSTRPCARRPRRRATGPAALAFRSRSTSDCFSRRSARSTRNACAN